MQLPCLCFNKQIIWLILQVCWFLTFVHASHAYDKNIPQSNEWLSRENLASMLGLLSQLARFCSFGWCAWSNDLPNSNIILWTNLIHPGCNNLHVSWHDWRICYKNKHPREIIIIIKNKQKQKHRRATQPTSNDTYTHKTELVEP